MKMGHASSIYHTRGSKDEILRLLPGGKEVKLRSHLFNADPTLKTFLYTYAFKQSSKDDLASEAALQALGTALMAASRDFRESCIPAGYTYLGQLIFHDITFMSPKRARSYRTPALDLDSVLPSEDLIEASPPCAGTGPLPVGCTTSDGDVLPEDLPRVKDGADRGKPLISDPRNDDFLPLAQCHLLLLKFYNALACRLNLGTSEEIRNTWLKHFQHIVLHDYVPRIVGPDTYAETIAGGRSIIGVPPIDEKSEWMPLEFAVACGRFGHSMIRDNYKPWNKKIEWKPVGVSEFMDLSYRNSRDKLAEANGGLPVEWVTNWFRLFDFTDGPHSGIAGPPAMAGSIDTRLSSPLAGLPERIRDNPFEFGASPSSGTFNLATASLLRGRDVGLATAQQALFRVNQVRPTPLPQLTRDQLVENENDAVSRVFGDHPELYERTPLWYYVLKEADVLGDGNRLGPLGGMVVMETLHAAIDASAVSILHDSSWVPHLPRARADRFTMADLISFAKNPNPLDH